MPRLNLMAEALKTDEEKKKKKKRFTDSKSNIYGKKYISKEKRRQSEQETFAAATRG